MIHSIVLYIDRSIYRYAYRRVIVSGDANCKRLKLRTCIHVLGRERVKRQLRSGLLEEEMWQVTPYQDYNMTGPSVTRLETLFMVCPPTKKRSGDHKTQVGQVQK